MSAKTIESPSARVEEVLATIKGVRDVLTVGRVFGDPYEIDGTTVIPVARVAGGAGGGGGEGADGDEAGSGFGSGFGMQAGPVGVYEVRDGNVAWKPTVDVTQIARRGQVLAGIAIVCFTLVLLRRAR